MKVIIDTTYAARAPFSGTAVYLECLCAELERLDGVELVRATNERRQAPGGGGVGSARNAAVDVWWSEVELPRQARSVGADVIHHALPARSHASRIPQVVTVHDLAFEALPALFDSRFRGYAHLTHRQAALAADVVIAVSHATAAEIRERWRVPESRIVVATHGPGQPLAEVPPRPAEHFLYVGDSEPRKDLGTLLAAHRRLRESSAQPVPDLVIAGSAEFAPQPGVRVEREVSRERLAALYAGALALVHPALYEGFGLTVLEAMSAGTPVIAATAAAVVELGAGALELYPPGDAEALAEKLRQLAGDEQLRSRLAAAGRERAAAFSWADCARAHVGAYSQAVASRSARRAGSR